MPLNKKNSIALLIPIAIGTLTFLFKKIVPIDVLDPLILSLLAGIILRTVVKFDTSVLVNFKTVPSVFLPVGAILYGAVNLNFTKFSGVEANNIFIIFIVFFAYIISVFFLSDMFKLSEKTGYLITAGSAICGASAIAITSKAIDADPDEVSVSLMSILATALISLFVVIPAMEVIFKVAETDVASYSGSVLHFTGFVKAAVANLSKEAGRLALSIKAIRYVGLLFLVPLLASLIKGKFYVPWFLWGFLAAGLVFSFIPELQKISKPVLSPALDILWSTAMASIGLNTKGRILFTNTGLKAFLTSFISFIIASGMFFLGVFLFRIS